MKSRYFSQCNLNLNPNLKVGYRDYMATLCRLYKLDSLQRSKLEKCFKVFLQIKLYGPFLWIGFNCLKARATSRRQFTLCTTKFPEIPVTHFIDLGRMKG